MTTYVSIMNNAMTIYSSWVENKFVLNGFVINSKKRNQIDLLRKFKDVYEQLEIDLKENLLNLFKQHNLKSQQFKVLT